jgi:DNA-binding transcriptional MerR regulator
VISDTEPTGSLGEEWTIDELARWANLPVRTIREYQTMGLLHPPRRSGRVGLYGHSHLRRLQLIARLQHRGYSLAGIADLLAAWRAGDTISDVLGLEPDELVHIDEPGTPATLAQLAQLLPALVPDRLDDLLATGAVEACGRDRYCIPSPSLLQLCLDAMAAALTPDDTLTLLTGLRTAADTAGSAVLDALSRIPADAHDATLDALVTRGRGLLAHAIGRLTLHRLGRNLSASDHPAGAEIADLLRHRAQSSTTAKTP